MTKDQDKPSFLTSREVLADMLLITPRQVYNLWKAGHIPKESRGLFDLAKVIPAIVRYHRAQLEAEKHGSMSTADVEKMTAVFEMELKRIKLAHEQKVVMNIEDIESALTPPIIATRKKLESLVKEVMKTFPADETPENRKAREKMLQKLVDEASTEMARIPESIFGERPKKKKFTERKGR